MIISHKHKFVFVHIPKTAGCSIADALLWYHVGTSGKHWPDVDVKDAQRFAEHSTYKNCNKLPGHATAREAKNYFIREGLDWDSYFKFAFIRNPWDRLVSMYFYGKRLLDEGYKDAWVQNFKYPFPDYIEKVCGVYGKPDLQYTCVSDYSGIIVDHIGKVENIQIEFDDICQKIGIPMQNLPHVNGTKHTKYTDYYAPELRDLVAHKFRADLELGGYTYDG